jgi:hypothetical protein
MDVAEGLLGICTRCIVNWWMVRLPFQRCRGEMCASATTDSFTERHKRTNNDVTKYSVPRNSKGHTHHLDSPVFQIIWQPRLQMPEYPQDRTRRHGAFDEVLWRDTPS